MFFSMDYLIYMIPAFIIMGLTSWYVKSSYNKWSRVQSLSRLTGAQAAQRLISISGIQGLQVQGTPGNLSDHYDPRNKTLYLSEGVANVASVASVAIAAHELGHAVQDAEGYFPMKIRSALVPAVSIGSNLGPILIIIGVVIQFTQLAWLGVFIFAGGALFALATLPVELNASVRAKELLQQAGIIQTDEERRGMNTVLNAAALTYVAGLITAVLNLLYYVSLVSGSGRRRD
ncbi:MAG: zinc metallopeptidase [Anaerolineales bacterium]|nr:zinc metallopeptidase [Anaerolineales bacterium]